MKAGSDSVKSSAARLADLAAELNDMVGRSVQNMNAMGRLFKATNAIIWFTSSLQKAWMK